MQGRVRVQPVLCWARHSPTLSTQTVSRHAREAETVYLASEDSRHVARIGQLYEYEDGAG